MDADISDELSLSVENGFSTFDKINFHQTCRNIKKNLIQARDLLDDFLRDEKTLASIAETGKMMEEAIRSDNKIISCGNGGSMCDAVHFAEELTGRFRENRRAFPAIAISDSGYLSCAANDYGYDSVFSRYVEALGKEGDVLLSISTSGNSANVIKAAEAAGALGMKVVGLTGKDGGKLAALCHTEIRAPFSKYADRAQEIHIMVIHCLIDYIERNIQPM